jgi:cell division transport system permease protein
MSARAIDIPFDRDGSGRFLPWLIALMVYLAALGSSVALALDRALQSWDRGLAGAATVELPPAPAQGDGGLAAALAALKGSPGVLSARPLDRAQMAKLVEPWLGPDLPQALRLPRLIDVRLDTGAAIDLAALKARLGRAAPGAVLDDHRVWLVRLQKLVRMAEAIAACVVFFIAAAAVLTVIFTTRTGLSVHRDAIELLHLMGARDGYIARQFERQALRLGLAGGTLGLALALVTIVVLGHASAAAASLGETAPLPSLGLAAWHWLVLLVLPVAAALLAMVTARITVLGALARMP